MSKKPLTLTTPPAFQCYDCQACGACCRGRFAIIISRADRNRLEAQGWSADELGLGDQPLYTRAPGGFQLAHRADGACVFLDEAGRCRIHARFGEPAKPLACRLYPFRFVPLGSQVRIDVRFDCPSTSENFGHPIPSYRNSLLGLMSQVVPEGQTDAMPVPPLYGRVTASWAQLSRLTETFERVLMTDSLDLTRRVLCGVTLSALLRSPRVLTLEGRKLSDFLEQVSGKIVDAAREDTLPCVAPPAMVRMAFRQWLGVYGRHDRVGEAAAPLQRLRHAVRMLVGRGLLPPLHAELPAVPFAEIEQSHWSPTGDAAATLERYLHFRLVSMGFFGRSFYGRSYLDGMNALLLTYPLVCWLARAYALGRGLAAPDAACVAQAVRTVDHQHGITPLLDLPSERIRANFLCDRSHLRALTIWYGM